MIIMEKITANFCEPRTHRFHAGIDVRTFGEIGSNLYAIDSESYKELVLNLIIMVRQFIYN